MPAFRRRDWTANLVLSPRKQFLNGQLGVWNDSKRLETTWFAPPALWGLATLVSGVFGVLTYWILHASTLGTEIGYREDRVGRRIQRAIEEEGTKPPRSSEEDTPDS